MSFTDEQLEYATLRGPLTQQYAEAAGRPFIGTVNGNRFYKDAPRFDIAEMAHALSMMCRFTGHCRRFYSVMEHSLLVSDLMALFGGNPLEGLLHDGTEAYMADIASPWKAELPDYQRMEKQLDAHLRAHFGLPRESTPECHHADKVALIIEARGLLASRGEDFDPQYRTPRILADADAACIYAQHKGLLWVQSLAPGYCAPFLRRYDRLTGGDR